MTGARLTAALECANDAGGRCALWPSGDAHACYGVSHDTATSCAFAAGSVSAARAALTGTGATPQAEGLVRARGPACVFTRCPRPPGVAPDPSVPRGKAIERRWRRCRTAISHQRTGRGARGAVPPPARCPGSGAGSWGFEGGRSIPSPDRNVQHCVGQEGRERERASWPTRWIRTVTAGSWPSR